MVLGLRNESQLQKYNEQFDVLSAEVTELLCTKRNKRGAPDLYCTPGPCQSISQGISSNLTIRASFKAETNPQR